MASTLPITAAAPAHHAALAFHLQVRQLVDQTVSWLADNSLRIAIAVAIGIVLVLVLLGVKKLGQRLCHPGVAAVDLRTIIGRIAEKTSFWFLVVLAAKLVDGYADAPPLLDRTIAFLFTVGLTFQAAMWAREVVLGFVEYRAGLTDHDHSALGSAIGIIRFLVTFTLFALALILVLDNVGVNVTGLVAGLGIGGIAIGLAAQGIFKDLFAALAIIFDRPFRRGDNVKWNNISGTVERIGLKTTRIRAVTGELVVVGNANLLEKELYNLDRLDRRRIVLTITIASDTPEDAAENVPDLLHAIVDAVPKCAVVRVGITGFAATGIQYELQFDVKSNKYNDVFDARNEVCVAILRHFNGGGIAFAGPDGKALPQPAKHDTQTPPPSHPRPEERESAEETAP